MLSGIVHVYSLIVLAAVILSWFPGARENAVARWIASVTEPVFTQIRRVIPPIGGFDLSPILLLLALQFLRRLVA